MKTYILMILSFSLLSGCYTQFALTKHDTWHDHEEYVEEYYEGDTVAVAEEDTDVYVRHIYVRPMHRHGVIHYDPYWDSWDDSWDCWDYGYTNIYVTSPYYWGVWDYPWGYPYYTYGSRWGGYWHPGYNYYNDPYYYGYGYGYGYGHGYGYDRNYRYANFKKRPFSRRVAGRSSQIMRNPRRSDGLHTVQGVQDARAVRPVRTASVGSDVKAGSTRPERISKNGDYVLTGGSDPVGVVRSPKRSSGNNDDKNTRRDRTVVRSDSKSAKDKKTVNERKYYNTPVPIENSSSNKRSRVSNSAKRKSDKPQVSGNSKRSPRIKDASKSTRMVPKHKKTSSRSSVSKSKPKSSKVTKSASGSKSKSVKRSGSSSRKSSGSVSKPSRSSGSRSSGRVSSGSRSSGSSSSGRVSSGSRSSGSRSSGSRSSGSRSSGGRSRSKR